MCAAREECRSQSQLILVCMCCVCVYEMLVTYLLCTFGCGELKCKAKTGPFRPYIRNVRGHTLHALTQNTHKFRHTAHMRTMPLIINVKKKNSWFFLCLPISASTERFLFCTNSHTQHSLAILIESIGNNNKIKFLQTISS